LSRYPRKITPRPVSGRRKEESHVTENRSKDKEWQLLADLVRQGKLDCGQSEALGARWRRRRETLRTRTAENLAAWVLWTMWAVTLVAATVVHNPMTAAVLDTVCELTALGALMCVIPSAKAYLRLGKSGETFLTPEDLLLLKKRETESDWKFSVLLWTIVLFSVFGHSFASILVLTAWLLAAGYDEYVCRKIRLRVENDLQRWAAAAD